MNGKILALLFTITLTGAAEASGRNRFNGPAEGMLAVAHNPMPLAAASHAVHYPYDVVASTSSTLDRPSEVPSSPLYRVATSILSWKHRITAFFAPRNFAESCMARAVYFEARSESRLGQLAVATVILNRTKSLHYPSSICGVVYQGSSRLNACQFSFACDGKPDFPERDRAWEAALEVTALALGDDMASEDGQMQIVSTATHYHADYVRPRWSRSLHRLAKIGRHVFYSQG